jgi:hypothetical protein
MQETRESNGILLLYLGTLLITIIVAEAAWSEYKMWHLETSIALSACGFLFWFIRFGSTEKHAPARMQLDKAFTGNSEEFCLREFYLNGYLFQPYEQQTPSGRQQFRLASTPQMSPDREAAVIRYLINEALSEDMWPQISGRIEEEANWAFFA